MRSAWPFGFRDGEFIDFLSVVGLRVDGLIRQEHKHVHGALRTSGDAALAHFLRILAGFGNTGDVVSVHPYVSG